jgi:hypothetical protein
MLGLKDGQLFLPRVNVRQNEDREVPHLLGLGALPESMKNCLFNPARAHRTSSFQRRADASTPIIDSYSAMPYLPN